MHLVALIILVVVCGTLWPYARRVHATSLWAGRKIAAPEFLAQNPAGLQSAIMPKRQRWLNLLVLTLSVVIPVYGWWQAWYLGIAALLANNVVMTIAGYFTSNNLEIYLIGITLSLLGREADFRKKNDHMRADVAQDIRQLLDDLLDEIHGQGRTVPSIKEARSMSLEQ